MKIALLQTPNCASQRDLNSKNSGKYIKMYFKGGEKRENEMLFWYFPKFSSVSGISSQIPLNSSNYYIMCSKIHISVVLLQMFVITHFYQSQPALMSTLNTPLQNVLHGLKCFCSHPLKIFTVTLLSWTQVVVTRCCPTTTCLLISSHRDRTASCDQN